MNKNHIIITAVMVSCAAMVTVSCTDKKTEGQDRQTTEKTASQNTGVDEQEAARVTALLDKAHKIYENEVETTADAKEKGVDISCSDEDIKLLLKVVQDPYIKDYFSLMPGIALLGPDPVGAARKVCCLLGLAAAQNETHCQLIFETLGKKANSLKVPELMDWLLMRIAVSDCAKVNEHLRTLADKVAAMPDWEGKEECVCNIWKSYGLRVREDDVPRILGLLKDENTKGRLASILGTCLGNLLEMEEDREKAASIANEAWDALGEERCKPFIRELAKACCTHALEYYKAKLLSATTYSRKDLGFLAHWGNDDVLDVILELKQKAEGLTDEMRTKAVGMLDDTINSLFCRNRERSKADVERLLALICKEPHADTSKLQEIIAKTDKDSTIYVGDDSPELPALEEQAEKLKESYEGKLKIINDLSGLRELPWVVELLDEYAKDADINIQTEAKQAREKIKENTRNWQETRERFQRRQN